MTHRHVPYTGTSADYEVPISSDNAAPSAVGDANVDFRNANRYKGPKAVTIKGRFTGSAAASVDITVTLYQWDPDANAGSGAWHMCNGGPMIGTDGYPSLTAGGMIRVETDPNCRYGYLRVNGLAANQVAELMVTKVE